MSNDRYVSPLSERYASREMQYIFSPDSAHGEDCGSRLRRRRRSLGSISQTNRSKSLKATRMISITMWRVRGKKSCAMT